MHNDAREMLRAIAITVVVTVAGCFLLWLALEYSP